MAITDIRDLQPQSLWQNFYKLTQSPRPSHHLEKVTAMLMEFGKTHGLETINDKAENVIFRKPATPGMENAPGVVLQAHMDMVPQKEATSNHNFETDPIETVIDGEWVHANHTTLGADDGIGVAAAMAILESSTIKHGPLEVLITANEETGMYGAFGLQHDSLKGKILLNLDSETEGELYIGCAGGVDANINWTFKGVAVPTDDIALKIEVSGLKGGHSGIEINAGRANANKLLFRILKEAIAGYEARLASAQGGNMRNAIPRDAWAVITVPSDEKEYIEKLAEEYQDVFNDEYHITDNKINVSVTEVETPDMLVPEEIQDDFVNAIIACPNEVMRYIPSIPDTVETSMNLSIIQATPEKIDVQCLLRSSLDSKKQELASMVESVFTLAGAKVEFSGEYSGWNPDVDSKVLKLTENTYEKDFGKKPEIKVIHAGLECGIIGSIIPGMDMVSFGPTIESPHTPHERVNIKSVEEFYKLLVSTLENIK